jgi:hypothetical protein
MPARAKRHSHWKALRVAAAALCLVLVAAPLLARTLTIQDFKSAIVVLPDGTTDVTETIQAHFAGQWNGIYRTIPVEYDYHGLNYTLDLDLLGVTDDSGATLRCETSRQHSYLQLKIHVPGANDVTRTIIVHYRVLNAVRFFEDHDELYWNVTGDEWDVPIQSAEAQISLPQATTGLHVLAFTGTYGSKSQDARTEVAGSLVTVVMQRPLAFHEGLTAVVGWDKGFVHEPTAAQSIERFLQSNWPLGIPILAFVVMAWVWWTRGRDPRRNPIAVQYEPPGGLTPGELGTLVDASANMRDITATLVDLAVRGYILIEEKEEKHLMGLYSNKDYSFHLLKKAPEWVGLKRHEEKLLSGMFTGGTEDVVTLSELHNKFYTNLQGIKDSLLDSLVEHGYYLHRPDIVRGGWIAAGVVVAVLMIAGGVWVSSNRGMQPLPFVLAGIATGIVIIGWGWFMPAHTNEGMRALEGALGFEDFLQHVESDRIQRIEKTPALFEKFLPYAMALGVEKKWVGAFQGIFTQPPSWYQGGVYGPNFYALGFVNGLNAMSMQAASVMSSAPRSASGSGFGGGGGFSGGGFGGGGGGGF